MHGQIDQILRTANLFALKQQNKKQGEIRVQKG